MLEKQAAPLPRTEFTSLEEDIFSDLSGERTLKMIDQFETRARSWQSKQTELNKDIVRRGANAMADCASVVEDVWQSVHHRTLRG
jgi:Skp family chaperone for outer membrane proteins